MAPLQRRLAALRRRLRVVTITRGLAAVLCVVLAVMLAAGWLDWELQLPSLVRGLLLTGMLAGAGYVAFRFLVMPLTVRADNLSLALRVEECYPELNDALASTVQFLEQSSQERTSTGSPTLRREAARQAMKQAEKCDFRKAVSARGLGWGLLGAALLTVAGMWIVYQMPALAGTALARFLDPFGGHTWTILELENCPRRVAVEQPYRIAGTLSGIVPENARIELQSIVDAERTVPIKTDKDKQAGSLTAQLDMTQHKGKFRFRIRAGDAAFPADGGWHEVEVVPPPEWTTLNGAASPQIELYPPTYTGLPSPTKLKPGVRTLDVIEGTRVRLQAAIDRPIVKAWVEYERSGAVLAAMLSPLGAASNFGAVASASAGHMVWGQFPARLGKDGKTMSVEFEPRVSSTYTVYLQDAENLIKPNPGDLRVQFDPVPIVQLERPASSQEVLPNAVIAVQVRAYDEQFAVRSVFLEYRRRGADRQWLDTEPKRVPLHPAAAAAVPPERQQQVEVQTRWPLAGLVEEGQTLVVSACADDFNDVVTNPPGRSGEIELRIVSPKQLARIHDEKLGEIQQELLRLQRMQEQALKTVEQVRAQPGKEDYKKIVETEQQQKQIRERVGMSKEEGLRGAVTRMQQALRDNELPPSNVRDQLRTLDTELERVANEDLQQIEPNLAEARKEMDSGKLDKLAALEKAEQLQEDAKKSFDELLKFLDPWASVNVVKGQARELLKEQRELKQATEKLLQKMDRQELAAEAGKAADTQSDLKQRLEALIQTMKEAGQSREQKGETHTGELLKEAAELARKADLPEKMRQAQEALENNRSEQPLVNNALDKQQESIEQLEKVIAALEERREDEIARLMKKQSEAQKKLEDFVERLQKKSAKAEDRDKTKAELEKLQEEVKQTARELAQAQADKASKALNRAAEKLERALRQLEKEEDPEEARKEALEEVENAAEELAEAEEELAREQLAQISDQLKGLKERQDAALKESQDLHQRSIVSLKRWTTAQLMSLRNLGITQSELAGEADTLKKKLESAIVFKHILEKAGDAMRSAAAVIEERRETGPQRVIELEEEELAHENRLQARTIDLQQQASKRLDHLLEALKDAPPQMAKQEKNDGKEPPKNDNSQQGGGAQRPGDRIPDAAQLKALREEQIALNQRTQALSAVIANSGPIGAAILAQQELNALRDEQAQLQELLQQIAAGVQ